MMSTTAIPQYHPTRNFFACIARRLCVVIIRLFVNDYRAPHDITDTEAVCPTRQTRLAVYGKQGREVACVVGVRLVVQVEMRPYLRKVVPRTAVALVDMERKALALQFVGR